MSLYTFNGISINKLIHLDIANYASTIEERNSLYTFNDTPINKLIHLDIANSVSTIEERSIESFKYVMCILEANKKSINHDSIFRIIYNDIAEPNKQNISNYIRRLPL